ncbi:L,D-transpeptidase family protein [Paenibacillus tyrfis]|uniref:L,D-transpeptidase family protein n=1 Tax=Paenibacillus tyrfis TaxID=1501230 RepID=UPI00209CE753|nr:L,D-transpeptidase family protein [Paenibacillus tyrfis]MCP1306595.1 L,D-transpeptidase family protein [Paenibacillus tyrfis]
MQHLRQRFKSPAADKLVRLHKNIYLNRNDPKYHEKVITYLDPHSPEAHYKLGQYFENNGNIGKALQHYKEAMSTYPSPYYFPASGSIRRLTKEKTPAVPGPQAAISASSSSPGTKRKSAAYGLKMLLLVLLFINVLLLALLYGPTAVSKVVSAFMPWSVGKEVTYESVETAYVLHFPYGEPQKAVEEALHKKALQLANDHPKQTIVLYGIASGVRNADNQAAPLSDEQLKAKAFVLAEYNPAVDTSVKIRFLHPEFQKLRTTAGAQLIRTALDAYAADHGSPPSSIEQLFQPYPNNYASYMPIETITGSAHVRTVFDGSGGWVYDARAQDPARRFYPNVAWVGASGAATASASLPFEPVTVTIDKSAHLLRLNAGPVVLAELSVGLGADGRTPDGALTVLERVREPQGSRPGVYGTAALGMGEIAIHGTTDAASIGANRSLGCIRLTNEAMSALYPLVPRGSRVVIGSGTGGSGGAPVLVQPELLLPGKDGLGRGAEEKAKHRVFQWLG